MQSFPLKNAFENVVCKLCAILFRSQYVDSVSLSCVIVQVSSFALNVGMPLLTRCHWQCLDRLSQIFATLCKICFYLWFSIENEVNAGNFCPGLNHWALLLVQFGFFSKKIEYFGNYVSLKFCLLSKIHFQQNCIHGSDIEWMTNL